MLGETIGHYRILEQLGAGGMGVVYRARDHRLERDVAIKVIRPEALTPTLEAAFLREARLASSLNHPGIVTIYDVLSHEGVECIVMEFVQGEPLNRLIPASGFAVDRAVELALLIGDALAAAHAAGIVHRDLKPANILVRDDGRIKILDFGLATLAAHDAPSSETRTMSLFGGKMVGTIAYMAPEQALGTAADQRVDIFSFGVILSQMLTGALPFRAPNPVALMRAVQLDDPEPVRAVRPEIPQALEAVTLRALAKEPAGRFRDIPEMMDLLRLAIAADAAAPQRMAFATGASSPAPARGMAQSAPQSIAASLEKASIAVLPFRSVSPDPEDGYLAAGLASEVTRWLTGVPRLRVAPQHASFRLGDQTDVQTAAKLLNTRYVVAGTLRRAGERLRVHAELVDSFQEMVAWTQTYDRRMTDIFEMQEEISRAIVSSIGGHMIRAATDTVYRIPTENLDAWGLVRKAYHIWNYEFSPQALGQAISMLQRAIELDPDYAAASAYLGHYLMQMLGYGVVGDREGTARTALEAAERAIALAPNDPEVLECCSLVWLENWQYERAVQWLKRAIQIAPFDLVASGYLALAYSCAGGEPEVLEAVRILKKIVADAPDHPSMPYWLTFQTVAFLRLRRCEEAIAAGERSVELQPAYVTSQILLAEAYASVGRTADARRVMGSIPRFNPNFTVRQFREHILPMCRSEEYVDLLTGCCQSLQEADSN